jgi:hypothetical protein
MLLDDGKEQARGVEGEVREIGSDLEKKMEGC